MDFFFDQDVFDPELALGIDFDMVRVVTYLLFDYEVTLFHSKKSF